MLHQATVFLCALGLVSAYSLTSHAQNTDGALQLGLGTDVLSYTSGSVTVDTPVGERSIDASSFNWGFSQRNGVDVEGGYGLGESLVLGGFLALGGWSQSAKPDGANKTTESGFTLALAPKLDYMFMPESRYRPFVGGAIGLSYQSNKTEVESGSTTTTTGKSSLTGLLLMARVGVRCFVTPGFSLDPALTLGFVPTASGSYAAGATSYDASASQFSIGLSIAASGWIGL